MNWWENVLRKRRIGWTLFNKKKNSRKIILRKRGISGFFKRKKNW